MKNGLKKGVVLCLAACLLLMLTACGGYSQKLTGTWERDGAAVGSDGPFGAFAGAALINAMVACSFDGSEAAKLYLLASDGTERNMEIRYAATDNTLTIDPHETEWSWGWGYDLQDRGKTLVIDLGPGGNVTFRKAG